MSELAPHIAALIMDGISQGICRTDYPEKVAEMTFLYSYTVFDDLVEYGEEEKQSYLSCATRCYVDFPQPYRMVADIPSAAFLCAHRWDQHTIAVHFFHN